MIEQTPTFWGFVMATFAAVTAWASGESGRIALASSLGGLARWAHSDTKTVKNLIPAVSGGLLAGMYAWPFVLLALGLPFGGISETPSTIDMAAFVAGAFGMSLLNIIIVMIEARMQPPAKDKE